MAKEYPPWQKALLEMLEKQVKENGQFADNKTIAAEIHKNPDLKSRAKGCMSFVQAVRFNFTHIL